VAYVFASLAYGFLAASNLAVPWRLKPTAETGQCVVGFTMAALCLVLPFQAL